ncbi:hypothetical protein DNU06_00165 [Putridiphycobacter roseus]|uniref:NlpC/P60 domain-containing protein n=1 Tax=Putridiphycobacter roseus TaxID=2219161 RepID=A0A2W1N334_9FLAO|nr:C40 family peptidase [Putridiphycobacter roseus]PZE18284.1 hypothetical protein DNU06_00165 [Putridiphycobacter roseus]
MKAGLLIFVVLLFTSMSFGQDKKIDQLEVLYSQKHYTKVLRKANKLLAIPDYDYSGMPTFYKSLALFRLASDVEYNPRHPESLEKAIETYIQFLAHSKANIYSKAHYFEIAALKRYLIGLEKDLTAKKELKNAIIIRNFLENQLQTVRPSGLQLPQEQKQEEIVYPIKNKRPNKTHGNNEVYAEEEIMALRSEIISTANAQLGVPYKWAGTSPKGFDCSGYTGFVYNSQGIQLPRSAAAQKEHIEKIKISEAREGDLVFFKSGSKITHVGIVTSAINEPLTMIHASTSSGIITTNIETSKYWRGKLAGVGRIIP